MATEIRVSWAPNPPSEQVVDYRVFEQKNGGPWVALTPVVPASGPLQIGILNPLPGVYNYKIQANNVAGTSVDSDVGNGPTVPSKPSTPVVTTVVVP